MGEKRRNGRRLSWAAMLGAAVLAVAAPAYAAQAGWVQEEDGWHFYHPDGSPASGWLEDQGKAYYLLEDGLCLTDSITPDGFYVDESGAWYKRTARLFETVLEAPEKFVSPGLEWPGKGPLYMLKDRIEKAFTGGRSLKLTETAIEYVELTDSGNGSGTGAARAASTKSTVKTVKTDSVKTVLAGLYQDRKAGRYRLDLRIRLNPDSSDEQAAATYDYALYRAMLYQVSSSPELLEEAIRDAWQGKNRWNISRDGWVRVGDSLVAYASGDGYGRFYICPAEKGMEAWMQTGSN